MGSEISTVDVQAGSLSSLTAAQQRELLAKLLREKAAKAKSFPMSVGQMGLWHAFQRDPSSTSFNVFLPMRIRSPLNTDVLKASIELIVDRHASLRTTFSDQRGELKQQVHDRLPPEFSVQSALGASSEELQTKITAQAQVPFDLSTGPLIRLICFHVGTDDWIVLAVTHHIVVDFWSLVLQLGELRSAYPALLQGLTPRLRPPVNNYAQFVSAQQEMLSGPTGQRHRDYWKSVTSSASGVVELPTDRIRPATFTGRAGNVGLTLCEQTVGKIKRLASACKSTPFAVVQSAQRLLIARYSNQDSFFIGSPFSGRGSREFELTTGFFINMLPLKVDLTGQPTFRDVVLRTTKQLLEALEHEAYPISMIVQESGVARDPSRSPLFQVSCTFEKSHVQAEQGRASFLIPNQKQHWEFGGTIQESFYVPHPTCHYDVEFIFEMAQSRLHGLICYCRDLFDESSIRLMADNFETLLDAALGQPDIDIRRLPWTRQSSCVGANLEIPNEEVGKLQSSDREAECAAGRSADFSSSDQTLVELIRQGASLGKNETALRFGQHETSYGEFWSTATALAHHLQQLGLQPGDRLPVAYHRGAESVIAIMATQLAGGAPSPVDLGHPTMEAFALVADLAAPAILAEEANRWCAQKERLWLHHDLHSSTAAGCGSTLPIVAPGDLAYVVYTSGSTGRPKGVLIEHRAVSNTLAWRAEQVPLQPGDRVLLLLSHQFDAGLGIVWTALSQGATVVWGSEQSRQDPNCLIDQILQDEITVLPAVPSLLRVLVANPRFRDCSSLRYIWTGGETMPPDLPQQLQEVSSAQFWNFYGPTETAIEATACHIFNHDPTRPVTIGTPIRNTEVLVLDSLHRPVPKTVPGEIAIGGVGLAKGYLNQPQLTIERFIPHPNGGEGKRVYLTGDRGRILDDGQIEFLGRTDHQVKVRGYRIELGEIEAVIEAHQQVDRAAVKVIGEGQPNAQLLAFAGLKDADELDAQTRAQVAASIRRFVAGKLPAFKMPAALAVLDSMPMTTSGKVDRKRLPNEVPPEQLMQQLVPPSTKLEEFLLAAWSRQLETDRIGVNQNFFEAGGGSLQAAILTTKLSEELGVHVPTALVFDLANVSQMALRLVQLYRAEMVDRFGDDCVTKQIEAAAELATGGSEHHWHPLIAPLKPDGSRQPIFMVHPPGGIIVCYRELSQELAPEQPLLGIRSHGLHGQEDLPPTIEAMASSYLDAIRSVQPAGPYLIGGWSLGGLIAYEMAQQMLASGQQVSRVILLDTTIPQGASELVPASDTVNVGQEYGIDLSLEELGELAPEEQLPFLWDHAEKLGVLDASAPPELVAQVLEELRALFHHHVEVARQYRMKPLDAAITLFRPTDTPFELNVSTDRGWARLSDRVNVQFVPGQHHSMVQSPHVRELAGQLTQILEGV